MHKTAQGCCEVVAGKEPLPWRAHADVGCTMGRRHSSIATVCTTDGCSQAAAPRSSAGCGRRGVDGCAVNAVGNSRDGVMGRTGSVVSTTRGNSSGQIVVLASVVLLG